MKHISDLLPIPVELDDDNSCIVILDQTLLPKEEKYIKLYSKEDVWHAIKKLQVRGAPAIGITAAFGAYLALKHLEVKDGEELYKHYQEIKHYLNSSRPTAVNLSWALEEISKSIELNKYSKVSDIINIIKNKSIQILNDDIATCSRIGELGLSLLKPYWGILTHCNAGQIATSRLGTALSPIFTGQYRGYNFKVFADETRPLLQGARLTTFELMRAGVDVTLICDNMASMVMNKGWVQAVLVGADRIALNGDTANKIGTSGLAIMAKHYKIPFYVCAPTSTIDIKTLTGKDIEIEERQEYEISQMWYGEQVTPDNVKCYNPAFDVTDNELISAIITEEGVLKPPFEESILKIKSK